MENETPKNIDRLLDVEMNVTVRFGSTQVPLRDVANFGVGSMIELDRTVDEPVELLVNNAPFARGEVVVVDGYYGVRVSELVSACEHPQTLISRDQPANSTNEVVS
jgi:flagellar motor switch protein FliN/FliY